MKKYIKKVAAGSLLLLFGASNVHAAPAVSGPLCGVTGTVESVGFKKTDSSFLGRPVTSEYYIVTLMDESIDVPTTASLDARAAAMGWTTEELIEKRNPATDNTVCENAYSAGGAFAPANGNSAANGYIYSYYNDQPIEVGQKIAGLIKHGGDERLAGVFLSGVVLTEDQANSAPEESPNEAEITDRRSIQQQIIALLQQLLQLLQLR